VTCNVSTRCQAHDVPCRREAASVSTMRSVLRNLGDKAPPKGTKLLDDRRHYCCGQDSRVRIDAHESMNGISACQRAWSLTTPNQQVFGERVYASIVTAMRFIKASEGQSFLQTSMITYKYRGRAGLCTIAGADTETNQAVSHGHLLTVALMKHARQSKGGHEARHPLIGLLPQGNNSSVLHPTPGNSRSLGKQRQFVVPWVIFLLPPSPLLGPPLLLIKGKGRDILDQHSTKDKK